MASPRSGRRITDLSVEEGIVKFTFFMRYGAWVGERPEKPVRVSENADYATERG